MRMKADEFIENAIVGGCDQEEMMYKNDVQEDVLLSHADTVKKWTLWCFNYQTPFEKVICQIWGGTLSGFGGRYYCEDNHFTQHLIEKWQSFESRSDARMLFFYCDLDSGLQQQLVDWVIGNYAG